MYHLLRPLLFRIDPETAHIAVIRCGAALGRLQLARSALRSLYTFNHPMLETTVCGIHFKNPVGLAAGFDKNAELMPIFSSLGFGFVEIGTVTPLLQIGNPRPRLFRVPKDQALINRMGFNNDGVAAVVERLKQQRPPIIVGGNIGKNKTTPNEEAARDYEICFRALAPHVDYLVVNVSSPNTPNLRSLQEKEPLTKLLRALVKLNAESEKQKPIFIKIAPDLTEGELDDIVEVVRETGIHGIIATNTTVSRDRLLTPPARIRDIGEGGLSGAPIAKRSTKIISHLYRRSQGAIPIIGVGGVCSVKDAYEKIKAGASLVQLYTGLIYEGPIIACRINRELVKLLKRDGFTSVTEAVGKAHALY